MNNAALYEHDFQAWIERHITLLKEARFAELDIDNLVEELEDMGRSNKRELVSRCIILIAHLLKWQYQADQRSTSWRSSIIEQRASINYLLKKVPSLKNALNDAIQEAYSESIGIAIAETRLPSLTFPSHCPYTKAEVLNADFYPES
jgi:Domain of unknown function DUF29